MRSCLFLLLPLAMLTLNACSEQKANAYDGKTPVISVKQFYSKPIVGYGMFQGRSGEVADRYYVTLIPSWNGNEGTIQEKQWNDQGKLFLEQTWHITADADGRNFTGVATKIEGAIQGETRGYAMHMIYTMLVPRDNGKEISLAADDWTYLQPDGLAINKVVLSKLGVQVGEVTYVLHPLAKGEKLREGYAVRQP